MHRPTEIRHAPADGVGGGAGRRAVELGGGGQQNLQRLLVVQVRIALHDQGQRAGGVGRGHRGTGLVGVAAAGHGAVDQAAGRGDAPVLGDAAAVVALAVLLVEAGHGQPVAFQVRLEVGQGGAHAGVGVAAVAGAEDVDHALAGDAGGGVQPGGAPVVLGIGGVQAVEGLVADVLGLAAPTVVDRPHPGVGQRLVGGLEIVRVGRRAEQEAVVLVGVGDIHLCRVGHPVHADAVARGAEGAADVGTVGVVVAVHRAADAERRAVDIGAAGRHRLVARGGVSGWLGSKPESISPIFTPWPSMPAA